MNNSLAEVHPELVSEWSEKNKIKPTEVSIGIKCQDRMYKKYYIKMYS